MSIRLSASALLCSVLFSASAACVQGQEEPPGLPADNLPVDTSVTIAITLDVAPEVVVVREGVAGEWRAATKVSAARYEAKVHGAYTVAAVCASAGVSHVQLVARTVEDEHTIPVYCTSSATAGTLTVSGTMVQPGTVTFGPERRSSTTPNWSFQVVVPAGTYDLVAASADRVVVQRGIAVSANQTLPGPIDAQQGTALVNTAFTVTNARAAETTSASVFLMTKGAAPQAQLYRGPLAAAKVAPGAVIGAAESQEVSVRGEVTGVNGSLRTVRRAFSAGGGAQFTLPDPLGGFTFGVEGNKLVGAWTSRSALDQMRLLLQTDSKELIVEASRRYLDATGLSRLILDTDFPGFKPEWNLDFAAYHSRQVSAEGAAGAERWSFMQYELRN